MIGWLAALQPLLVGAVLVWSGGFKVSGPRARRAAAGSALAKLLGAPRALPAYRAVGGVELVLGTLMVLPPPWRAEPIAATALCLGFLGYLVYAAVAAPQSSCGCMSARRTPLTWRGFARAVLLLAASALAIPTTTGWWPAARDRPGTAALVLLVEVAAIAGFSPEFDPRWLLPLRRLRTRLSHPLAGDPATTPLHATVTQLQRSEAYRRVASMLRSDVREYWDAADFRIMCFSARYGDRPATAVFAVPRLRDDPESVRVAIVDDENEAMLVMV